ncbi:MAG: nucleoside hydrolase [Vicinamibacterales bacterium]|nr:nucleoside hydrolase [Vicinamibacterales bacterium]
MRRARRRPAATTLVVVALAGLVSLGISCGASHPIWIDTDPAAGLPERDVDDALALAQAFAASHLTVRGVSAVFGNAPLSDTGRIAADLVRLLGPAGVHVFPGASSAGMLGVETEASRALAEHLREESLTILVLGPATNVATVVMRHPALTSRIREIVAVAGRRPGQRFTTGTTNPAAHRDLNFELDPEAFRVLLDAEVPLTLTPFEISSQVWLTGADLDRLATGGLAAQWLAGPARAWLQVWRDVFAVDGFNPFDTLAVAAVATPQFVTCEMLPAAIVLGPDDGTEARMQGTTPVEKPYLTVAPDVGSERRVRYCFEVAPEFKDHLIGAVRGLAPGR